LRHAFTIFQSMLHLKERKFENFEFLSVRFYVSFKENFYFLSRNEKPFVVRTRQNFQIKKKLKI